MAGPTGEARPLDAAQAERIEAIIALHAGREGPLLPILNDIQAELGCVPGGVVPPIAHALNLSRAEVHGTISFYHDYRREPAGRHTVKLCRSEACQAMGGEALAERLKRRLGIGFGQTRKDGAATLEAVYCLGLCACAPAAMVDGRVVGRLDAGAVDALADEVLA